MKIVVPVAPGGASDLVARILAEPIARATGQPVIVENRPGAVGQIAGETLRRAKPDGSTLLLAPISLPVMLPMIQPSLTFDPSRDFAPIAQVGTYAIAIAVRPDHPARDVRELVAWIRSHPSRANYGTIASGSLVHFVGVMFAEASGVTLHHIPFRSASQVIEHVVGGDLSIGIGAVSDFLEIHRAGKLRILATTGPARAAQLPTIATVREQGYAVEAVGWTGLFAPAGTPRAIVDALSSAIVAAVQAPGVRDSLIRVGLDPTGTSPEAFAAIVKADIAHWTPAVKASGFRAE